MNKFRFTIKLMVIAIFTLAFASIAQAQATRTWVSGVGDDVNPCSRTAPCKTFAGAISKTAAGGEIDALDPGGFGAVTITKAITIDGTGTLAGILSSLTNGVIVNAGANDLITLRGLTINGVGNGINGIRFLAGKGLNVINCQIQRGTGHGIDVSLNTLSESQLTVTDCIIKKWGGSGISITNAQGGAVRYTIERTLSAENTGSGIHVKGANSLGTARNCVFALNTANGVFADAVSGVAVIRIWASQITGNGTGVRAGNAGNAGIPLVEIAQNQIDQNIGNGVLVTAPGIVETFTNNSIKGNGTNGCTGCTGTGPGN